ncbi:DUF742 domain-containing protein [Pengzhenrongella frigida]|uniref:DUF742 domain-containing protein n=1 Tax=Pengzhenrongella frigida TaxID=1259133 RepID=UPI001F5C56B6|nr:DUF742 domain-containing protein [Cellulomonas sp. HLT2-17]
MPPWDDASLAPHEEFETRSVRPYSVTGGRVRSATPDMPLEALVEVLPGAVGGQGLPAEKRAILQHAAHTFVTVVELSALLHLPIGVVRVIVADLADAKYVRVHTSTPADVRNGLPAMSMSVLESVLNGLSAL